jgi:NhaP-type Na+/H+ or K+/H+ antiporter
MCNIETDVIELAVNASSFSRLGSTYPIDSTWSSNETPWWIWLIIALAIAIVIVIVVTVAVVFTNDKNKKKPKNGQPIKPRPSTFES